MASKHVCRFFNGKMVDVTMRGNSVHCRRCGAQLSEDQIEEKTLEKIKDKINKNNEKAERKKAITRN